jgi:hypothetical protein
MDPVIVAAIGLATSFAGSMLSLVLWIHFDLEGHWRHRQAVHGERLERRARERDERANEAHAELLAEGDTSSIR